ncbi:hypothetical protein Vi05172_g765 [Venturia inaequalis]|nr:hypothetical protein Vi05172_g765 [Venturia inaequalis]
MSSPVKNGYDVPVLRLSQLEPGLRICNPASLDAQKRRAQIKQMKRKTPPGQPAPKPRF